MEFVVVVPILVMVVFGIIEFGRGYNAKVELTGAVREGARVLALGQSPSDAIDTVIEAAPSLAPAPEVFVDAECPNDDDRAVISATYEVDYSIPLIDEGTWELSVTGVMRCGV
ncbi:MAG: TadE/TadG family type IV pilus assembly protein [Acidimicrobiales bacterium]